MRLEVVGGKAEIDVKAMVAEYSLLFAEYRVGELWVKCG